VPWPLFQLRHKEQSARQDRCSAQLKLQLNTAAETSIWQLTVRARSLDNNGPAKPSLHMRGTQPACDAAHAEIRQLHADSIYADRVKQVSQFLIQIN
jgi:hypothetical protein